MTPVLSRAQMRAFDARAIARGVPGPVLMENAGRGATDVLERELLGGRAAGARVVVVCGPGNNGGDGLVIARHLAARGASVEVLLAADPARLSGDAASELAMWRGLGGQARELTAARGAADLQAALAAARAVVDALFGTGLDRPLAGLHAGLVEAMSAARCPVLAVDLPSGLDADTGAALGVAVRAAVTATFAFFKLGLLTPAGTERAGRVHVVDLGVSPSVDEKGGTLAQQMAAGDLRSWIGARASGAHKGSAGHVAIVGGSAGKIGAPQLVARGAMRAGAGLATIATWPEAATAIEGHVLEVMTARLDPAALPATLDAALAHKQAVVMGPGLGVTAAARSAVEHVLSTWRGPLVLDADALTALSGQPASLQAAAGRAVLTPHPGEAARLLGTTPAAIEADRFGAARQLAAATGAVVVLKGAHTLIAAPGQDVVISPVACPALATAGSGDVLSGIVGALACGLPPRDAACAGVLLHGLAGLAWSRAHGGADRGLLASELADALPALLAGSQGAPSS